MVVKKKKKKEGYLRVQRDPRFPLHSAGTRSEAPMAIPQRGELGWGPAGGAYHCPAGCPPRPPQHHTLSRQDSGMWGAEMGETPGWGGGVRTAWSAVLSVISGERDCLAAWPARVTQIWEQAGVSGPPHLLRGLSPGHRRAREPVFHCLCSRALPHSPPLAQVGPGQDVGS